MKENFWQDAVMEFVQFVSHRYGDEIIEEFL